MDAVEEWTQALYTLDDQAFLSIMRNYLGPIKTPFHKPDLIHRLIRFISHENIKYRIVSLIDDQERIILNAIYLLNHPSVDDIYHFFTKEIKFYVIQQIIINLEERLLIYQRVDDSLSINPILFDDLVPEVINIKHIIAVEKQHKCAILPNTQYIFEQPFHIAILSIFASGKIRVNSDGTLRKTSIKTIQEMFPFLSEEHIPPFIHSLITGMSGMGIIGRSHGIILPNNNHFEPYTNSSWKKYFLTFLANCFLEFFPLVSISNLYGFLSELFQFTTHIRPLQSSDFYRIWNALCSHHNMPLNETSDPFHILSIFGILYKQGNYYSINPLADRLMQQDGSDNKENHFIIDSDFTITCDANLTLAESRFLYIFSRVITTDMNYRFEITKKSCIYAFDLSYTLTQIMDLLNELSHNKVPHNIEQTITQWKHEYDSLQIYSGIIVTANENRRRILEKHPALQDHIIKTLAPGIFLFNTATEPIWRDILISSGIDTLPKTKTYAPIESHQIMPKPAETENQVSLLDNIDSSYFLPDETPKVNDTAFIKELRKSLSNKQFARVEYEDLSARIDKKLILSSDQLISTYLHPTSVEATGFDYQGKLNLCKQALSSKYDLLELHIRSLPDQEEILLIRPTKLLKEGNNYILSGTMLPDHQNFSKSLRKIFLLRKLKSSLYTPI